jgi:hypothetical protein
MNPSQDPNMVTVTTECCPNNVERGESAKKTFSQRAGDDWRGWRFKVSFADETL